MDQSVDDRRRHLFVVEDSHPPAEFKVCCDDHAPSLVAVGYDLDVFCKQEIPKNAKKNPQWGVGKNGVMQ